MSQLPCDEWRQWQARASSSNPQERREAIEALQRCAETLGGTSDGVQISQILSRAAPPPQWITPAAISEFQEQWKKVGSLYDPNLVMLLGRLSRQKSLAARVGNPVCADLVQLVRRDLGPSQHSLAREKIILLEAVAAVLEELRGSLAQVASSLDHIRDKVTHGRFKLAKQDLEQAIKTGDFSRAQEVVDQVQDLSGVALSSNQIAELRKILSDAKQFGKGVDQAWRQYNAMGPHGHSSLGIKAVPELLSLENQLVGLLEACPQVVPVRVRASAEDLRLECLQRAGEMLERQVSSLSGLPGLVDFCQVWEKILQHNLATRMTRPHRIWEQAMGRGKEAMSDWTRGMPSPDVEVWRRKLQGLRAALQEYQTYYDGLGELVDLLRPRLPAITPSEPVVSPTPQVNQGQILDQVEELLAADLCPEILEQAIALCQEAPNLRICQILQQHQKPLTALVACVSQPEWTDVEQAAEWFGTWKPNHGMLPPDLPGQRLRQALENELLKREEQWRDLMNRLTRPPLLANQAQELLDRLKPSWELFPENSRQPYQDFLESVVKLDEAHGLAGRGQWELLAPVLDDLGRLGRAKEAKPLKVRMQVEQARQGNPEDLPLALMGLWDPVKKFYGADAWVLVLEALDNAWEADGQGKAKTEACRLVEVICPLNGEQDEPQCDQIRDWAKWLAFWPKLRLPLDEESVKNLVGLLKGDFSPPLWRQRLRHKLDLAEDTVGLAFIYRLKPNELEPRLVFIHDPAWDMESQALAMISRAENLLTLSDIPSRGQISELSRKGWEIQESYNRLEKLLNLLPYPTDRPVPPQKLTPTIDALRDLDEVLVTVERVSTGDLRKPDLRERFFYEVSVRLPNMEHLGFQSQLRAAFERWGPVIKVINHEEGILKSIRRCGGTSAGELLVEGRFLPTSAKG